MFAEADLALWLTFGVSSLFCQPVKEDLRWDCKQTLLTTGKAQRTEGHWKKGKRGLLQHSVATERAMDITPLSTQTKSSEELIPDLPERLKLSVFTIKQGPQNTVPLEFLKKARF